MKLTLNRVKELQPSKIIDGVINCKDKEEAEDVLIAAACWLTQRQRASAATQSRLADRVLGDPRTCVSNFPMDTD